MHLWVPCRPAMSFCPPSPTVLASARAFLLLLLFFLTASYNRASCWKEEGPRSPSCRSARFLPGDGSASRRKEKKVQPLLTPWLNFLFFFFFFRILPHFLSFHPSLSLPFPPPPPPLPLLYTYSSLPSSYPPPLPPPSYCASYLPRSLPPASPSPLFD